MAPRDEWVIEPTGTGTFDVFHNGRVEAYDRDDLDEALRYVRRKGGQIATVVAEDGYRTPMRVS